MRSALEAIERLNMAAMSYGLANGVTPGGEHSTPASAGRMATITANIRSSARLRAQR